MNCCIFVRNVPQVLLFLVVHVILGTVSSFFHVKTRRINGVMGAHDGRLAPRKAVWPSGGGISPFGSILRRDLRFSRMFLSPSTHMNLKMHSDNLYEPFEISTPGALTGLGPSLDGQNSRLGG